MSETFGITSCGSYVPRLRLERAAIQAAHAWMSPASRVGAKGTRAFCGWDEDTITMAVEAGRSCLAADTAGAPARLTLASNRLPYADMQNSMIVAGALGLPRETVLGDVTGSERAGVGALLDHLGSRQEGLIVLSDAPRAKPASAQEMANGAGAAAFALGFGRVIAELVGSASIQIPFIDHFRPAGASHDYHWEERWVRDEGYLKLIPEAVGKALVEAGIGIADIDTLVAPLPLKGGIAAVARKLGFAGTLAPALEDGCGHAGLAQAGLMLAGALDNASPGDHILVVGFGEGATAFVLRVSDAIRDFPGSGLADRLAAGIVTSDYLRMLSFSGEIALDWGVKAEKSGKAALTSLYRAAGQLATFSAGRCQSCGTIQFPQLAYCVKPGCHAPAAQFVPHSLVDEPARVLTYTADWLSHSPAPPLYVGFVQFDCGARVLMEMVDLDDAGPETGLPMRMVFRIKEPDLTRGFNRYFWKATPLRA